MSATKDISKILGEKLLLGWVMLNDVCAKCVVVPLLEDRSQKKIHCLSCNRSFKREGNDIFEIKYVDAPVKEPVITNTTNNNNFKKIDISDSNKLISEAVLKYNNYQFNGEDDYDDEEDDDYYSQPLSEEEKKQIELRMQKSDQVSTKIGEFLLLGWTLLSDLCPNDNCLGVPLLKNNKEQKYHCVSCSRNVLDISELKSTPQQVVPIQPDIKPQLIETKKKVNTIQLGVETATTNTISPTKEPSQKRYKPTNSFDDIDIDMNYVGENNNNNNNFEIEEEISVVTDRTLRTLIGKLKKSEFTVSHFPETNDLFEYQKMREYATTISTLLELKKQLKK
ncbi:Sjogrens syndrome scleroderma autoantigen 1 family protein [Tieghemostelium lacteum]|uniref:Sjogrens syndrome scleroderma autoantigen 1 family protein n=1 Tax=Tieghemostelium lacteum TaxID=361077 RepID=A0A152A2B1_TIELA|nr:Sjogrens syndrome scleroderma autoantigen 1 family protein [Tieghemostelium lacteum]|eukprot:KYR00235.1 Sjogrens syndrome scleroderma autoantigen 1 family protein [Tieghemostelium lacteum]